MATQDIKLLWRDPRKLDQTNPMAMGHPKRCLTLICPVSCLVQCHLSLNIACLEGVSSLDETKIVRCALEHAELHRKASTCSVIS